MSKQDLYVLKYYHYTLIAQPVAFREAHHLYCLELGLRGRIKIASEGINGTISGSKAACETYMRTLKADARFSDISFNITLTDTHVHEKLHVRLKKEIVYAGLSKEIAPSQAVSERHYINMATFKKMRQEKDVVLLDVRSSYEHALGKFTGSVTFDIPNYRSFFKEAAIHTFDKKKRYIVICTRGIKSEKARDYLRQEKGLPYVYHLKGGILDYAKNSDGEGFEGVCYVFDKRLVVFVNKKKPVIISHCHHCKCHCIRMVNCANADCNLHVPLCEPCGKKHEGACSMTCRTHEKKRPYNEKGYYVTESQGYNPCLCSRRKIDEKNFFRNQ